MKTERMAIVLEPKAEALNLMPLKVLDCSLVLLCGYLCLERPQIPALPRSRILFSRVQSVFTGLKFPDHAVPIPNLMTREPVGHQGAFGLHCSSKAQREQRELPNPAPGARGNSSSGSRDQNNRK
jgi:hypothetical protein